MGDHLGPLVVVCLAPADLRPEVDPLRGEVTADLRRCDLSASDAAALELGLRAADAWTGRVVAIAAGPPEIEPVLAQAVALGAEALRVAWPPGSHPVGPSGGGPVPVGGAELGADLSHLARALAGAIRSMGSPALVVCGDRSPDRGVGVVPALLAHELGLAQALGLVRVDFGAPAGAVVGGAVAAERRLDGGAVTGERRLDGGWRESLRLPGPAVISVEAAGIRLRRASLAGALAASGPHPPVAVYEPGSGPRSGAGSGLGSDDPARVTFGSPRPYRPRTKVVAAPSGSPHDRLLALTGALSSRQLPRIVGPLDAATAADELLAYLERNGFLA